MNMDSQELRFAHTLIGNSGKIQMKVTLPNGDLYTDKFDVTDIEGRERFSKKFRIENPAVPADELMSKVEAERRHAPVSEGNRPLGSLGEPPVLEAAGGT